MSTPIIAPLPSPVAALTEPAYRRVLLKLSGEALMGDDAYGINREVIDRIVAEIGEGTRRANRGGHRRRQYLRGVAPGAAGITATADYMGMLVRFECAGAADAMRRAAGLLRAVGAVGSSRSPSPISAARRCAIRGKQDRQLCRRTGNLYHRHRLSCAGAMA
jgi:hypothetical protein